MIRSTFQSALAFLVVLLTPFFAKSQCGYNPDADGDWAIGAADLLSLLSLWSEFDSDADGVWDSQDDCVGSFDDCGVCNGPGPSVPVVDSIVYVTDSTFISQLNEWYVFTYATDTIYSFVCPVLGCTDSSAVNFNPTATLDDVSCLYGPVQCNGLSSITFDNYTYALVGIGDQCWFAENLRADNFRNGDPIPGNLTSDEWGALHPGWGQAVFGEGNSPVFEGNANEEENLALHGRLYNWYATNGPGLCPSGFHVPSDSEWMTLEISLGMTPQQAATAGYRGTDQGAKLKSSSPLFTYWNGDNSSGFDARPSGIRSPNGTFLWEGSTSWFWTSTVYEPFGAWMRYLTPDGSVFRGNHYERNNGASIRCLKD